ILAAMWVAATRHSLLVFTVAFLLISSRQQGLLNVEHDCVHGNFVPGRRWNELVAVAFAASACGSPFFARRARHLAHHRLLGTDRDPDARLHRGPDKERR